MAKDMTLHAFYISSYWPSKRLDSDNWKDQIRWAYDGYIGDKWGGLDMDKITRREVQSWLISLVLPVGTLKSSTVRRIKIVLSNILNMAIEDGLVETNPVTTTRLPADAEPEKTALTLRECKLLIDRTPTYLKPTVLMMLCGLRIGEACAPDRASLVQKFGKSGLEVSSQVLQPKGGAVRSLKLKTVQSKRFVPLPAEWFDVISKTKRENDNWLSCNADGGFLLPTNLSRELKSIVEIAKIPPVSPHELRHTFISILENELEAPTAIVARLAGRKHAGSTAGYSHTHVDQLARWMDKYAEAIKASTICTTDSVVQMTLFEPENGWCPGKDSNLHSLARTGT